MKKITLILTCVVLSIGFSSLFVHQQTSPKNPYTQVNKPSIHDIQSKLNEIAKDLSTSVVSIIIAQEFKTYESDPFGYFYQDRTVNREIGGGTGVIITRDGKILTNKHVVSVPGANYIVVMSDGREYSSRVLATDPITDIAVLQVEGLSDDLTPASFIDNTSGIDVGDLVIAMGNALSHLDNTLTFGVVSATGRSIQAGTPGNAQMLHGLIQTDAAINRGNSGGPLVNLDGNVIGINTAMSADGNGVGFAIPYSKKHVENALNSIENTGTIQRAYLGIYTINLDAGVAKEFGLLSSVGAYIPDEPDAVIADSPASQAGLLPGDIIVGVGSETISNDHQLQAILASKAPGEQLRIDVLRGSDTETLTITLGAR